MIVSFWTNEVYRLHAERLAESLRTLGLPHEIEAVPDAGGWIENLRQKPAFIRRKLDEVREDVLWVDADAVILKWPVLLSAVHQGVAAYLHSLCGAKWESTTRYLQHGGKLFGGTLFFRNDADSRKVLDAWIEEGDRKRPDVLDQDELAAALDRLPDIRFLCLPPEYCWIESRMRVLYPSAVPVIEHFCVGVERWGRERAKRP